MNRKYIYIFIYIYIYIYIYNQGTVGVEALQYILVFFLKEKLEAG